MPILKSNGGINLPLTPSSSSASSAATSPLSEENTNKMMTACRDDEIYVNMTFKPIERVANEVVNEEFEQLKAELKSIKNEFNQLQMKFKDLVITINENEKTQQHEVKSLKKRLVALTAAVSSTAKKPHDENYYSSDIEDEEPSVSLSKTQHQTSRHQNHHHHQYHTDHIVHF